MTRKAAARVPIERERPELAERVYLACVEPLTFSDGLLEPPAVVERLEPNDREVRALAEDARRDLDWRSPRQWIVISWNSVRRRVPSRAFRRLP